MFIGFTDAQGNLSPYVTPGPGPDGGQPSDEFNVPDSSVGGASGGAEDAYNVGVPTSTYTGSWDQRKNVPPPTFADQVVASAAEEFAYEMEFET